MHIDKDGKKCITGLLTSEQNVASERDNMKQNIDILLENN